MMFQLVKKVLVLPRAIWVSYVFVEAWDLLGRGDPQRAMEMFNKGEKAINQIGEFEKLPFRYDIMKGKIEFNLNEDRECLKNFASAWKKIEKDKNLSEPD